MMKLYYTEIITAPLCSDGSDRSGALASTTLSFDPNKKFIGVNITGFTPDDAKNNLIEFLSDGVELIKYQN
jgi:hypothetical protein